ncbi:hypothetical protein Tco_0880242, partial [Tanacetum coccineum]
MNKRISTKRRDAEVKDAKNPLLEQTGGSKSQHKTAGESAQTEEHMHTTKDLEEPTHQEFKTRVTEDQHNEETPQYPDWFQKPTKLPSPDRDWNKTLPDAHGHVQPWLSSLAQKEDPRESFNELMDTPLDFSAFVMNQLKVDTLTPELLTGPTFELMKGKKKQQYPHDLQKPLPLIPNSRGCRVIPFDHFINNDLEYLSGGVLSQKYATSMTKTKAVDYRHIKWIEDLFLNRMWSQVPEGDVDQVFRIQDIKDMLLLIVQGKLTNLTVEERQFTRNVVIQRRVEDLQLGVKSYQKKLNLTKPDIDGTLNDVWTALDDRLKGIQMEYLPQTIWRQSDKDKAGAMVPGYMTKAIARLLKDGGK